MGQRRRCFQLVLPLLALILAGCTGNPPRPAPPTPTLAVPPAECAPGHTTIQALVNAASSGGTVNVTGCIFREPVTINKPLTLSGYGAQIRGSDIWTAWNASGAGYVSNLTVPPLPLDQDQCRPSTTRCRLREQVFVDGVALIQIASGTPTSNQFVLDGTRHVVIAVNPAGHTIEVTTRESWITVTSSNVTVQGFTMKHAAVYAQHGALASVGNSNVAFIENVLSDAHGANVSIEGGASNKLLRNEVFRGGQLGVHGDSNDTLIQGNRIHDNNTEDFNPDWEAGGLKVSVMNNATISGNEAYSNGGTGLWCDISCTSVTIANNRTHHNERNGISYEISGNGHITGNVAYENGWGLLTWAFGAGINCQNCHHTEIDHNLLAWNADGIAVISQNRQPPDGDGPVVQVNLHDNTIISTDAFVGGDAQKIICFCQDWAGYTPTMQAPEANNRGSHNALWWPHVASGGTYDSTEDPGGVHTTLAEWQSTRYGSTDTALSDSAKDAALTAASIPLTPIPRP